MGLLKVRDLDNIPPVMRRYEEMISKQKKEQYHAKIEETDSYLGAPIRGDITGMGVTFDMTPAPDYVPIWEIERVAKKELSCTFSGPCFERFEWKLGEVRRHATFVNCHEIVYFPMLYGRHPFSTKLAKHLWVCYCTRAKPDMAYLAQLKKCFISSIHQFEKCHKNVVINNLMLNDSIYCLNWFDIQSKQQIIRSLTTSLRGQDHVYWLSAENTLLLLEDGLRLLLAISVTSGLSLKTLHLWYFFSKEALPLVACKEMEMDDPYISYRTDISAKMLHYLFFSFVMRSNNTIPYVMKYLVLHVSYFCLESLEVLSAEYRYLAGGQGESLLYLGCIRNGTLRELNLLFTHNDLVETTNKYICENAWKKAYKLCPCLRINFVALQVNTFSSVIPALKPLMPVEGFYASTDFKTDNLPLYANTVLFTVINNFKRFLKRLHLYFSRPLEPMDFVLSKIFMELPFLEDFLYQGSLENINTLHNILKYIENHTLRIRKFQFHLAEDPCDRDPYIKVMREINSHYEPMLVEKGIDFKLDTYY